MKLVLVFPIFIALFSLGAAYFVSGFVRPSVGAWGITVSMVFAVSAVTIFLALTAAAGLSEIPIIADLVGWCRALYGGQHGAPPIVGFLALITLTVMVWRVVNYFKSIRGTMKLFNGVAGVHIVDSKRPVAFAVPGNPGGVVMSRMMVSSLTRSECLVVLAHENAHLRFHHHVFVRLTRACALAVPFLSRFGQRVSYLTERWADEFASDQVGSRQLVADTIARVALMPERFTPTHAQPVTGSDVLRRFEALNSPVAQPARFGLALSLGILAVAAIGVGLQVHNLLDFFHHTL